MREIKFRAWDEDTKEMLTEPDDVPIYYENDNGFHSGRTNMHGDWTQLKLMQHTGLKDRNGIELYEKDIVAMKYNGNGTIEWNAVDACFQIESVDGCSWSCGMTDEPFDIIGNIYHLNC